MSTQQLFINIGEFFAAMTVQQAFALLGGVFTLASLVWNGQLIVRRKVQPAPASWAVWASLDIGLAFSMHSKNTLNPQMAVAAAGAFIVFLLTLQYGKPGWNPIDKYCLMGGIGAIGLWALTGNPTVATALTLVAIAVGCWPTYKSILEDRSREDKTFWCLAFVASWCALIGTTEMTFDALGQPVVFVLCQTPVLWFLYRPEPRAQKA